MSVAGFTVARPVFTTMTTLIALTLGGIALARLPIDLMPDLTYPTLSVIAQYGSTGPEEMERLVTRPIEEAIGAVPGVEEMASQSAEGQSQVRVSFVWGTDLDVATNDIRDRLDRIADVLPEDMDRPQIRKFDVASFPILLIGVSSRLDPIALRQLVDEQISYHLERVPGVAAVDIWGGLEREIHVDLHPDKLAALGLGLEEIRTALREANVLVPAGQIERGRFDLALRTPGEFTSLEEIAGTVVATEDGAPIHLHQIADVRDTHTRPTRLIRIDGEAGIRLAISKQSGSNTVEVAEAVKRELERLRLDYPQLAMVPVMDTSAYIERAIANVGQSILYGGSLAVLVLLYFLRDLRGTLIVATAIPISIIATFMLIYFSGLTLNLMTLGGLALGVGMMVDNAIVVTENIVRLRTTGQAAPRAAAIQGSGEVTAAVVASTLTTMVIFLPMIFARDLAGMLFRQLGYVVAFSLLCSLASALTLVPMLSARFAKQADRSESGVIGGRLLERYGRLLDAALRHPALTLVAAGTLLAASLLLVPHIGGEFMPATDEGEVRVTVEMEPGTRLGVLDERMRIVEARVRAAVPEIAAMVVSVGGSSYRGSPTEGEVQLSLVEAAERTRSSEEIAQALRRELAGIAGVEIRTRAGQGLFLLRRLGAGAVENLQVEVRGYELEALDRIAELVRDGIAGVDGVSDVRHSREHEAPQQIFRIDRERAADLGVSVSLVAQSLETAIAGSSAGQFRQAGDEFRILVKLKDAEHLSLEQILDLRLVNAAGDQVVLRNLVTTEATGGPIEIERKDQQRVVDVDANVSGRSLNEVVDDVRAVLQQIPVPTDVTLVIRGDYEEQQRAFAELVLNFVLATALVYMVLACLYESLVDPLVVMLCVPLAVIGVLVALFVTGTTFNVQSFIGCVMLIGIVINNAILLVDRAGQLQRAAGLALAPAVRQAGIDRLRPILMTSLTTILALVPLALGIGEGSEAQAPLARVVIGGLLSSTLITLVVVPVVYSLAHGLRRAAPAAADLRTAGS